MKIIIFLSESPLKVRKIGVYRFLISFLVPELSRVKNVKNDRKNRCTFQILGGCQGRRTGVGVTTVSNSLILGGWVTKVLKNGEKNRGVEGWVTTIF